MVSSGKKLIVPLLLAVVLLLVAFGPGPYKTYMPVVQNCPICPTPVPCPTQVPCPACPVCPVCPVVPVPGPTIGNGTWRVGIDVAPGTYQGWVPEGEDCFWARLSGFTGDTDDWIQYNWITGPGFVEVTIMSTDRGFELSFCPEPLHRVY